MPLQVGGLGSLVLGFGNTASACVFAQL